MQDSDYARADAVEARLVGDEARMAAFSGHLFALVDLTRAMLGDADPEREPAVFAILRERRPYLTAIVEGVLDLAESVPGYIAYDENEPDGGAGNIAAAEEAWLDEPDDDDEGGDS